MDNGVSDGAAQAEAYLALGRWDQAAACARDALRHDPDDGRALVVLAHALVADPYGNIPQAFDVAMQATRHQPDNSDAWLAVALATTRGYRQADGVPAAWQAVRLAPSDAVTHMALALTCANLVRIDPAAGPGLQVTAFGAAWQAVRLNPAEAENHSVLAWVCHVYGDDAGAETALRDALRLAPDGVTVRHVQGLVNLSNAHTEAGTRALAGLLRDDPTLKDVSQLLDRTGATRAATVMSAVLIVMSVVVIAAVATVRWLASQVGWLGDGRVAALAVWALGAATTVALVRRTARSTCSWRRLWQWLGERHARGTVVVPMLTGLVALVFAAAEHPSEPPTVVLSAPLVLLVGLQMLYLAGLSWVVHRRRRRTRQTRPV